MHGSGASSRNLRTDPDHDVWVDRVDDVGGIADSHEAAQLWLQSLSAANAGSEPQPIFVPDSVQQGLLEYYSNALSTVEGVRRKDDSAEHAEHQKRSATATAPGGSCDFACEGEDSEAVGLVLMTCRFTWRSSPSNLWMITNLFALVTCGGQVKKYCSTV